VSAQANRENTEVMYGPENADRIIAQFCSNARLSFSCCIDSIGPSVATKYEPYNRALRDMEGRGIKLRFITEMTRDNLDYCKELMGFSELRHLDGVKGNFAVSESAYVATANLQQEKPVMQIISSTVRAIVDQNHYLFETLWQKSIPAEDRIRQIEEGVEPHYALTVNDHEEIGKMIEKSVHSSAAIMAYGTGVMQVMRDRFFGICKELAALHKAGRHGGIRWLVTVSAENKDLVRAFLDVGVQMRHTRYQSPMTFVLDGKALYSTVGDGSTSTNFFVTSEPAYRKQFAALFEELWGDAVDARDKVKDIEAGVISETEVVDNPAKIEQLYKDMIADAGAEIMLLIQTPAAYARQEKLGIKELLKHASLRRVKVRLLTDGMPEQDAAELEASGVRIQQLSRSAKEAVTAATTTTATTIPKATTAIVDNKASLMIEIKDDSQGAFSGAIGSAVLSTSRSVVISYARIFESLWQEMEVGAQLKKMDRMQKEFINVAAHELRTPIMPILGIADMITSDDPDGTGDLKVTRGEVDIIVRNAKRLQRLSSDILDVTKIESDTLALNKTRFALNEVMAGAIKDAQSHGQNADIQFVLEPSKKEYVKADFQRIGQVVSNLLGNAAKFTKAGTVAIGAKSGGGVVTVTVTDTGAGIDPEILPKLFTKFTSKSETGTGLGLYISKKIVEAHGGKIWAENRPGGGALFCFTLPSDGTG
jgi:signal transduction histidine kinase